MRRWLSVVLFAACCFVMPADAQPRKQYMVYGLGTTSCGSWTVERATGQAGPRLTWITGFLSGTGATGISLRETDADGMQQWIDQYCATHPLSDFSDAAEQLAIALFDKK